MKKLVEKFNIFLKSNFSIDSKKSLYEYIWITYHRKLLFFIITQTHAGFEESEDIAQDIMIKIFNNLHLYNLRNSFNTWFYSIARNHCIDYLRKKRYETKEFKENEYYSEANDKLLSNEINTGLNIFIKSLEEEDQEIIFLFFYEEMTYKEISVLINKPVGTLKYKIFEIKKNLKDYLKREEL